ncbi:hypothetical protein MVES_003365 [Malassezia vespertilionis]|uniref:Uncharacterized protein n=1 Tax=Malassezia vespertilionis TaxID=2020962 RepID=A0A2N1J7M4_9BASI|nr:hypothetical protein MVES_003365 [Malassezia vespertilionis]
MVAIYPGYSFPPSLFRSSVGPSQASRYNMGIMQVATRLDPNHIPFPTAYDHDPALYDILAIVKEYITSDVLAYVQRGPPMYEIHEPDQIPNTSSRELILLFPMCIMCCALVYFLLELGCTYAVSRRPTRRKPLLDDMVDVQRMYVHQSTVLLRIVLDTLHYVYCNLARIACIVEAELPGWIACALATAQRWRQLVRQRR